MTQCQLITKVVLYFDSRDHLHFSLLLALIISDNANLKV